MQQFFKLAGISLLLALAGCEDPDEVEIKTIFLAQCQKTSGLQPTNNFSNWCN